LFLKTSWSRTPVWSESLNHASKSCSTHAQASACGCKETRKKEATARIWFISLKYERNHSLVSHVTSGSHFTNSTRVNIPVLLAYENELHQCSTKKELYLTTSHSCRIIWCCWIIYVWNQPCARHVETFIDSRQSSQQFESATIWRGFLLKAFTQYRPEFFQLIDCRAIAKRFNIMVHSEFVYLNWKPRFCPFDKRASLPRTLSKFDSSTLVDPIKTQLSPESSTASRLTEESQYSCTSWSQLAKMNMKYPKFPISGSPKKCLSRREVWSSVQCLQPLRQSISMAGTSLLLANLWYIRLLKDASSQWSLLPSPWRQINLDQFFGNAKKPLHWYRLCSSEHGLYDMIKTPCDFEPDSFWVSCNSRHIPRSPETVNELVVSQAFVSSSTEEALVEWAPYKSCYNSSSTLVTM